MTMHVATKQIGLSSSAHPFLLERLERVAIMSVASRGIDASHSDSIQLIDDIRRSVRASCLGEPRPRCQVHLLCLAHHLDANLVLC